MPFRDYLRLMRPHQWYKNFLVFLAIIFVEVPSTWPWDTIPAVLVWENYPPLIIGFIVLCAISSAGYIINDIQDLEKDAAHPEKRLRPLPSGRASKNTSLILAAILMAVGLVVAYAQSGAFFLLVLIYIINSQTYNYLFRDVAIIDVVAIAVGFIIRAIAGTFLIGVPFTSWLVIGVFFLALVLAFGKRKNELQLLGESAIEHKPVFVHYSHSMLNQGIMMSATWFVMFYALYCFQNFDQLTQPVMLTIPIVAGMVLRYLHLVDVGSPIGRKPHLALKDKGMFAGLILFGLVLAVTLFFWSFILEFFRELLPPLFPP